MAFKGNVIGGALNLRAQTSTSSTRLVQIPNGTGLTVDLVPGAPDWLSTSYAGYTGFVLAQYVAVTNDGGSAKVTTASGGLNVRVSPSTSATRIYSAAQDSTLRLLTTKGYAGWYCVSSSSGTGWAQSQFLTVITPVPGEDSGSSGGGDTGGSGDDIPKPTTQVTGTLSIGNSGNEVLVLKQRLTQLLYYVGTVNNYFDIYTQWAVKYFQHLNGLSVTGSTNAATNAKLNAYGPNSGTSWGVDAACRDFWRTNDPQQYYMNGGAIWANTPFDAPNTSNVETIGADGNCPTAFAMVASGLRIEAVTPPQVCQYIIDSNYRDPNGQTGVTTPFFAAAADRYDFIYHGTSNNWSVIQDWVDLGNLVLVRVVGNAAHNYCGINGATYLVIWKIENGIVYVKNPNYNTRNQPNLSLSTWMNATWVKEKHIYGYNG